MYFKITKIPMVAKCPSRSYNSIYKIRSFSQHEHLRALLFTTVCGFYGQLSANSHGQRRKLEETDEYLVFSELHMGTKHEVYCIRM